MRLAMTGLKKGNWTEDHRNTQSLRKLGRKRSIDACKAVSLGLMGNKNSLRYPGKTSNDRNLIKKYGITEVQYDKMLMDQDGVCKCCKNPESRTHPKTNKLFKLSVDHDHKTGKVRGLLCHNCNVALGLLQENAYTAYKLVQYIENLIG